ncbi:MAG: hypothetical protein IPM37_17000 [Hahellaceae bacterium]|nr:hypothetical protein [Hahellaceae bacterium]
MKLTRRAIAHYALVSALLSSTAVQADIVSLTEDSMDTISGQSGLVIEVGMGSLGGVNQATQDYYHLDWSNAGIKIDAFKWIVDMGRWNSATNRMIANNGNGNGNATV